MCVCFSILILKVQELSHGGWPMKFCLERVPTLKGWEPVSKWISGRVTAWWRAIFGKGALLQLLVCCDKRQNVP